MVESRLETNYALASRWGCILLIDEADVFLEARQTENFDRNSLVAGMPPYLYYLVSHSSCGRLSNSSIYYNSLSSIAGVLHRHSFPDYESRRHQHPKISWFLGVSVEWKPDVSRTW